MNPSAEYIFNMKLRQLKRDKFVKELNVILNDRFKSNNKAIKQFLVSCISKNNKLKEFEKSLETESLETESLTTKLQTSPVCEGCGGNDFIYEGSQRRCRVCGVTKADFRANPFKQLGDRQESGGSILPGGNIITINRNGKDMRVDLSQIAKWTDSNKEDKPLIDFINLMNEALEKLDELYSGPRLSISLEKAKRLARSMWYNIFLYKKKNTSLSFRKEEKENLLLFCIYASLKSEKIKAELAQLHRFLGLSSLFIGLNSYLSVIKEIFKETDFEKYFFKSEEIELPENIKIGKDFVLRHLTSKGYKIPSNDLGIILYLAKLYENESINLVFIMSKNTHLLPSNITSLLTEIKTFYERYPELRRILLTVK